jgi:DNA-binding protein HU-beta
MNQKELIASTASDTGISELDLTRALTGFQRQIARTISKGGKVTLAKFGTFEGRQRSARTARNPRTGERVKVKARRTPAFRAGSTLRTYVQAGGRGNSYSAAWAAKPTSGRSTSRVGRAAGVTRAPATATRATRGRAGQTGKMAPSGNSTVRRGSRRSQSS